MLGPLPAQYDCFEGPTPLSVERRASFINSNSSPLPFDDSFALAISFHSHRPCEPSSALSPSSRQRRDTPKVHAHGLAIPSSSARRSPSSVGER